MIFSVHPHPNNSYLTQWPALKFSNLLLYFVKNVYKGLLHVLFKCVPINFFQCFKYHYRNPTMYTFLDYWFCVSYLAQLFNRYISQGLYPDCLKVTKVTPIFKAGDKSVCSNYRPPSTFSILKIIRKNYPLKIITIFWTKKCVITGQYGFRKKFNTTSDTFNLVTDLLKSFKDKSYASCCFLDLEKAFDTVDWSLLLEKNLTIMV